MEYKTSHQLAQELLALPDVKVIVPTPVFDVPGGMIAWPATAEVVSVEGQTCVAIRPVTSNEKAPQVDKPKTEEAVTEAPADQKPTTPKCCEGC